MTADLSGGGTQNLSVHLPVERAPQQLADAIRDLAEAART
ncbi:hypothetical protein J2S41_001496 [Catenuloplanes atrovinosus]|uniref:Uncharacterized protein n=1 Tax=Catenuloplanes atrovinosus TaxID=137266 RepID=A0AAE3YJ04_9ACTN|nr:hypothetical protein [Catenuloplanes atrovinosus]